MQTCDRHIRSVDVFIDSERSKGRSRIVCNSKNRFSILSGSNINASSKLSVNKNKEDKLSSQKRSLNCKDYLPTKYYINKKVSRERIISKLGERSQASERKAGGITCSLKKARCSSRSYRIHTIDYVEQDLQKDFPVAEQIAKNESRAILLKQSTNTKINCPEAVKKIIKKKTIISNIESFGYQKQQKYRKNKKEDNKDQQTLIGLRVQDRRIAKSKTEINDQDDQQSPFKKAGHRELAKRIGEEKDYLLSERILKQEVSVKRIDFKRNKAKRSLAIEQCTDNQTLEIKKLKKMKKNGRINIQQSQNNPKQMKNNSNGEDCQFKKYLEFIRMGGNPHKKKYLKEQNKNQRPLQEHLGTKIVQINPKVEGKQNTKQKDENSKTIKDEINKKESINLFKSKELDCSSIKEINQSSFLSQNGKKQIAETKNLVDMVKDFQPHQANQQSFYDIGKFVVQKKKKRKKDSKMSWICRSDLKVFPERFFG